MVLPISQQIAEKADETPQLYSKLVIVAGPAHSGKTSALRDLETERGWPLVNINLTLSERLLDLTVKQRALKAGRIVDDIVREHAAKIVMLDNIEMLFHPDLQQDPLRLLQSLSRNRTVIATWRGVLSGRSITYGSPGHPEYRRYDNPEALVVATSNIPSVTGGPAQSQEHAG